MSTTTNTEDLWYAVTEAEHALALAEAWDAAYRDAVGDDDTLADEVAEIASAAAEARTAAESGRLLSAYRHALRATAAALRAAEAVAL